MQSTDSDGSPREPFQTVSQVDVVKWQLYVTHEILLA